MAEVTKIEWCDHTWSPWEGCTRVSIAATGGGGCDHCYAERMNRWLHAGENWGPGAPRREFSEAHWDKLRRWNDLAARRAQRPTVFPSMCDPLDNEVRDELRQRFFAAIQATPNLRWLLLTKRIGNAQKMLPAEWLNGAWPANLWFGITAVNQPELDRDAGKLLALPAPIHFLSYEPALGPIDASRWLGPQCDNGSVPGPGGVGGVMCSRCGGQTGGCHGLRWVIAGGESGPEARPAHPGWFRSLRDQCAMAGVPFLFKQWGQWLPAHQQLTAHFDDNDLVEPHRVRWLYPDGSTKPIGDGHPPTSELAISLGKKAAGRLLDGVMHDEYPAA